MRTPTTQREAFAWYRLAVFGPDKPPVHPDEPQCGYFAVRLVKGGVFVPARIWLHQEFDEYGMLADDEVLMCEVNGRVVDPFEYWDRLCAHTVPFAKYQHHKHLNAHAGWYELDIPEANPHQPIDWMTVQPPVFKESL